MPPETPRNFLEQRKKDWRLYAGLFLILLALLYAFAFRAPSNFPAKTIITLKQGSGLSQLSQNLVQESVVRSAEWFRILIITFGGEKNIQAGDYYLPSPENAITLAWRMAHGIRDLTLVKITIPEGFTDKQISSLFDIRFSLFNHRSFETNAPQGYLFPDTYFIQVNATATSTSALFQSNFHAKVDPLAIEIKSSGHSIYNIIDVASILQAEVKTPGDMAIVSGIIWKRLKLNMPLQVDSAPETYKRQGLPISPIDNPGLVAIKAAIHPVDSAYLYFISDKDGNIHYAKTLDEQTVNIKKYL